MKEEERQRREEEEKEGRSKDSISKIVSFEKDSFFL